MIIELNSNKLGLLREGKVFYSKINGEIRRVCRMPKDYIDHAPVHRAWVWLMAKLLDTLPNTTYYVADIKQVFPEEIGTVGRFVFENEKGILSEISFNEAQTIHDMGYKIYRIY